MKQIVPINNQDSILEEAAKAAPPPRPTSPEASTGEQTPQMTQPLADTTAPAANQAAEAMPETEATTSSATTMPDPLAASVKEFAPPQASSPYSSSAKLLSVDKKPLAASGYTYRLPLGSYLLALIYGQVALVYTYALITIMNMYAQYSSAASNMYSSSRSNSLEVLFSLEAFKALWMPYLFSVLMVWFLLSGKNILRFAAIGIAGCMLLYQGYNYFMLLSKSSTDATSAILSMMSFGSVWIIALLPLFVLVITIGYLLTPRAQEAYSN